MLKYEIVVALCRGMKDGVYCAIEKEQIRDRQRSSRSQYGAEGGRRRREKTNEMKTTRAGVFMHRQMMRDLVPVACPAMN